MIGQPGDVLAPAEVARMFGVNSRTVTRWAKRGRIPHIVTPGGHVRFRRADLEPYLRFGASSIDGDGPAARSAPETKGGGAG